MKIGILSTFLISALGASAQTVRILTPTANTRISAGQPFTASVILAPTTSSVDVLTLFFGARHGVVGPDDLGQTTLAVVQAPTFQSSNPSGFIMQNVSLTFPTNLINGLDQTYNLTMGEFFTLGAENTASTFIDQVPVFVASP